MGVLKIVYCMCTKAFLCVYCFVEMSQCHWQRLLLFSFIWYLSWRRFHLSEPMINLTLLSYSLLISFLFFLYYSWSRSYIQYMQAHSVLLSLVKAPSVQHLMWGEKKKVLLSISKIDGKERQPGSVAAAQGESRVVRQKTTLKTICTRIPSVSKSSGERVPLDRKTY